MSQDFWVFGYGSLMWRPGFPYVSASPALLRGYHRSFCIYSHHYRGTVERPGLVLGLKPGGSCRGVAFRIEATNRADVVDYLNERELGRYAYRPETVMVEVDGREPVEAYTFVVEQNHRQYAGDLTIGAAAAIIMDAQGCAGLNRDYLINTVRELEVHGFADAQLHALLQEVERQTGLLERGGGI